MTSKPTVLIAGASIAGPALAFWLARYGWQCTIVERAPAFRSGGQNIDIRGAAREVLRRSGLEEAVREATTGEVGTRFLGEGGRIVAEFPVKKNDTEGATAELEILRGDLARIFIDAAANETEYLFGDRIVALDDTASHIVVTFESGAERRFDLVVAADGVRSSTRRLVFGDDDVQIRPIPLEMAYLTIPRTADDTPWWNWYSEPGGRAVTLRPDRHGTTRAVLSSVIYEPKGARGRGSSGSQEASGSRGSSGSQGSSGSRGSSGSQAAGDAFGDASGDRSTPAERKARLRERFGDVGWQASRVLGALDDADDVYFETLGQVKANAWTKGRFALTGDAAWCASPVSGMGTSLSLVGAYVLAGELAAHVDHRDAFAGYERIMRPYVEQAQQLPPGVPKVANPRTRAGLAAFHTALRLASTPLAGRLSSRLFTPPADKIALPDYAHLELRGR